VRSLSNLEWGGETLRTTLDELAALAPDWFVKQVSPDWCERSSYWGENDRVPKAESHRTALAHQIGVDGLHLLAALECIDAPPEGNDLKSVQVLRHVWQEDDERSGGKARWRAGPQKEDGVGVIRSPSDPEAHTGKKRDTTWFGDNIHLTEPALCPRNRCVLT
jgi:transposase